MSRRTLRQTCGSPVGFNGGDTSKRTIQSVVSAAMRIASATTVTALLLLSNTSSSSSGGGGISFAAAAPATATTVTGKEQQPESGAPQLRMKRPQQLRGAPTQRKLQSCVFTPTPFDAFLAVNFLGDLTLLTDEDRSAIETAVVTAYNTEAEKVCDGEGRRLVTASILEEGGDDVLGSADNGRRKAQVGVTPQRFTLLFDVEGTCNNCANPGTLLFAESALGTNRNLQEDKGQDKPKDKKNQPDETEENRELIILRPNRDSTTSGAGSLTQEDFKSINIIRQKNPISVFRPLDQPEFFFNTGIPTPPATQSCDCLEDTLPFMQRPPTVNAFLTTLNDIVVSSDLVDVMVDIGGRSVAQDGGGEVVDTIQVEEVPCDALAIQDFESTVFVDVTGDPEAITPTELKRMGENFLDSFAFVNDRVCDPFFHEVLETDIEIQLVFRRLSAQNIRPHQGQDVPSETATTRTTTNDTDVERSLQIGRRTLPPASSSSRGTPAPTPHPTPFPTPSPTKPPAVNLTPKFVPFRFRFVVRGKCRGCNTDSLLFDQGFRRHLHDLREAQDRPAFMDVDVSGSTTPRQLSFTADDKCYCAIGSEVRQPEPVEFTQRYQEVVQKDAAEGLLPSVGAVIVTVEENESFPSAYPTEAPTKTPSASPTGFPTAPTESPQPSPSPTEIPSGAPSQSPAPSLTPSVAPVDS